MMTTAIQFMIRQSGWLALLLFLFAVFNGWTVGEGLWQGSSLHGYTIQNSRKGFPYRVSTWTSFIQMLVSLGLFGLLLGFNTWHRAKISRVVVNPRGRGDKGPSVIIFRSQSSRHPRRRN